MENRDQEDKDMITKKQVQKTKAADNDAVMMLAKKGAKKYRKTLNKLAKN